MKSGASTGSRISLVLRFEISDWQKFRESANNPDNGGMEIDIAIGSKILVPSSARQVRNTLGISEDGNGELAVINGVLKAFSKSDETDCTSPILFEYQMELETAALEESTFLSGYKVLRPGRPKRIFEETTSMFFEIGNGSGRPLLIGQVRVGIDELLNSFKSVTATGTDDPALQSQAVTGFLSYFQRSLIGSYRIQAKDSLISSYLSNVLRPG